VTRNGSQDRRFEPLASRFSRLGVSFLRQCGLGATAFTVLFRYGDIEGDSGGWGLEMIGYVVRDGRLLSLRAAEWLMLLVGGALAGSPMLLF
jgi:hypothetical protein